MVVATSRYFQLAWLKHNSELATVDSALQNPGSAKAPHFCGQKSLRFCSDPRTSSATCCSERWFGSCVAIASRLQRYARCSGAPGGRSSIFINGTGSLAHQIDSRGDDVQFVRSWSVWPVPHSDGLWCVGSQVGEPKQDDPWDSPGHHSANRTVPRSVISGRMMWPILPWQTGPCPMPP